MKRKKVIMVPRGSVDRICDQLQCKKTTVYNALRYDVNSELSEKIRSEAIENYGGIITSKIAM